MTTDEKDDLKEELQGYKAKIIPSTKATLTWSRELVFMGTTPQGYELEFDADALLCGPGHDQFRQCKVLRDDTN